MTRLHVCLAFLAVSICSVETQAQYLPPGNVALQARVSVSSQAEGTKPENLNDGNITDTEWRAKEGTSPSETWVELDWPSAVAFQEVVIRQGGSPHLTHLNVQVRDSAGEWQ